MLMIIDDLLFLTFQQSLGGVSFDDYSACSGESDVGSHKKL